MALWNIDLTTEDGSLGAAQLGGAACFVAAGAQAISLFAIMGLIRVGAQAPLIGMIMLTQIAIYFVAGIRLRNGKGLMWGGAAALMLAIELLFKIVTLSISVWLVFNVILLIVVVNGIRGVRALQSGRFDAEQVAEIFN